MNAAAKPVFDRRAMLGTFAASAAVFMTQRAVADDTHAMESERAWFSAFGLKMRVEVTAASTSGAMSATRVISPPGGGPPKPPSGGPGERNGSFDTGCV